MKLAINDQWTAITQDEFDQFRVNLKYTRRFGTLSNLTATAVPPATPSTSSATTPSLSSNTVQSALSPVDMFKRGIKRDPSVFPTLKDELLNDQWHHTFFHQARAQDVSNILGIFHFVTICCY
jgi:hypothetical protein